MQIKAVYAAAEAAVAKEGPNPYGDAFVMGLGPAGERLARDADFRALEGLTRLSEDPVGTMAYVINHADELDPRLAKAAKDNPHVFFLAFRGAASEVSIRKQKNLNNLLIRHHYGDDGGFQQELEKADREALRADRFYLHTMDELDQYKAWQDIHPSEH